MGGVGFVSASKNMVSRQEWKKYVTTLNINQHWPGIQGVGVSIPVQPAEKQAHIEKIRSEGFPEYLIQPEGPRDLYSAIIYLEPFDWRNQRAFGYDMWSNEMRRMAMMRARDEGVAATSGIITLVQETKEDIQRGFLTYLPVYLTNTIPKTLKERREQFAGWVYAPFRMEDLMKGILGAEDPNIEFEIFDGEILSQDFLLFDSNPQLHLNDPHHNPDFLKTVKLTLQGRPWTLYFHTPKEFLETSEKNQPRFVALAGGFVDLLLFYVIYAIYFINRRAEAIAQEMTQESRRTNDELMIINANLKKTTVSRDHMNFILQSMIDSLVVINPDMTIRTVNQATLTLLAYEEQELLGQPAVKILEEDVQEFFHERGLEKLIKKGFVQGFELTYAAKDGHRIPVLFSGSVMKDNDGKIQGIVCVAQDITVRKQSEAEIRQTNEKLIAANKELMEAQVQLVQSAKLASTGQIAAGLAHEINQPLGIIQMRADMTKLILESEQGMDKDEMNDNLNAISAAVVRASKIIKHLKIFSRQEKLMKYEKTDINWLIDESFVLMDETLRIAGIEVQKELAEDLPQVLCDYVQIEQVFTNLISNAKDALQESDEKQLVVRSYRRDNEICIDMKDTGCGIPETTIEKVFDPFFTSKPVGQGAGLGLSITHGVIQDHSGTLVVNSKEGEGTCFSISLPIES